MKRPFQKKPAPPTRAAATALTVKGSALQARGAAMQGAGAALANAAEAYSAALERTTPYVEVARVKAAPLVDVAKERSQTVVETARPQLVAAKESVVTTARESVLPVVQEGAHSIAERAREDVAPKVLAAIATAAAAAEPMREEAVTRGTAALAALKGEAVVPTSAPRRRRRFRLFSLLTVAALGAGYAFWRKRKAEDPWSVPPGSTSTYTPPSAPSAASASVAGTAAARDQAASAPDEALADSAADDLSRPLGTVASLSEPSSTVADEGAGEPAFGAPAAFPVSGATGTTSSGDSAKDPVTPLGGGDADVASPVESGPPLGTDPIAFGEPDKPTDKDER